MKTATVRQLRHEFGSVMESIEQGDPIKISKRGKVIAILSPPPRPALGAKPRKRPDFTARLNRIYGNIVLQGDPIVEDRDARSY